MKMHNPLNQFDINIYVPIKIGPLDISLTNASVSMLLVSFMAIFLMWLMTRRMHLIPKLGQTAAESLYLFIKGMIEDTIGKKGLVILPFIFSLFVFILFGNLLGLFPFAFTYTSHLSVVGTIAIIGLLVSVILGVYHKGLSWFRVFLPKGIPWALAPLMVPIEIISFLSKPFSLTVRLTVNMMVGHIMLKVIAGFIYSLSFWGGWLPLAFISVLTVFEMGIAVLQAYVYTILTCVYLSDALHAH